MNKKKVALIISIVLLVTLIFSSRIIGKDDMALQFGMQTTETNYTVDLYPSKDCVFIYVIFKVVDKETGDELYSKSKIEFSLAEKKSTKYVFELPDFYDSSIHKCEYTVNGYRNVLYIV